MTPKKETTSCAATSFEVIEEIEDYANSVLICSTQQPLKSHSFVKDKCGDCGCDVYFSVSASTRVKKICQGCGLFQVNDGDAIAVTETTMQEVLGELGLEDTPEVRKFIMEKATLGMKHYMERRKV